MKTLSEILEKEAGYRIKQAEELIFKNLISDWQEALVLPKSLREKLNTLFPLAINAKTFESSDEKTIKAAIEFDGEIVETVLIKHQERNTVCLSSQIGCSIGCDFCATGKLGLIRNLTDWEIVSQALFFARLLKKDNEKINNLVFMGMGEPMQNYQNVMSAIKILNKETGLNIGARKISISTAGVIEGIKKLSHEEMQLNLAISLHAPNNTLRNKLIPLNKTIPIEKLLGEVKSYIKKTKRKVMIEYAMLDGVNDDEKCAAELVKLLKSSLANLYLVNLIQYNPTESYQASSSEKIQKFKKILEGKKVPVIERFRFGRDIKAACGQLAGRLSAELS